MALLALASIAQADEPRRRHAHTPETETVEDGVHDPWEAWPPLVAETFAGLLERVESLIDLIDPWSTD